MATITGSVLFNQTNSSPTTGIGVTSIPITLYNTSTSQGLVVLTNSSGAFTFNNVPNATYTLVESYGASGVATPGDFTNATIITAPTPKDPPITAMPSPPAVANSVQSLSPNTLNLNVTGNLSGQNFIDGPLTENYIQILDATLASGNLITVANNGDWGTLPAGTAVNSSPATAPYPGVVPGFTYVQTSATQPGDGLYSVSNIDTFSAFNGAWWNMANHTTKDETELFYV